MAVRAEFGLLGPLYVRSEGVTLPVAAPGQRVVLAALAVRAGRVVSFEELSAAIWGDAPPPAARVAVRNQVSRLRHRLGSTGERVVTHDPGYVLDAAEDDVDLLAFTRLCRKGGAAAHAGAWQQASDLLHDALRLWRGMPLADVPSPALRDEHVPVVDALRLQAVEWRLETGLRMGRHDELVAEMERLIREHPLRERFRAQLMLALYRCGRQGDALAVYRSARAALVTELGVEPGQDLRDLHRRILAADPLLLSDAPATVPGQTPSALAGGARGHGLDTVIPRQLPADPCHFAGRRDELHELSRLLPDAHQPGGTVVISAISGTAGVGKTALAVHWAHRVAGQFPDGQLYVNLRGYDMGQPVPASDALAGFLRAFGLAGRDIPGDPDERAALYRSLLAGRRIVVVLDNARQAEQVRPLLPGSPTCMAVVTSRDALGGLVARDGAVRLEVQQLPLPEAAGLLRELIGSRASDDPAATVTLARQCCRLPLALRIAAERAAARPRVPLADLAAELADLRHRLDALETGEDERTAVRAVFSWSYRHLTAEAARLFRLLGLHPGPDITIAAAASLAGVSRRQARQALRQLAAAYLVTEYTADRYSLHDLLRAYAAEQAADQEPEAERHAAVQRVLDHYLHTAKTAALLLDPSREPLALAPAQPAVALEHLTSGQQALAWFEAEHQVLIAAVALAAETGFDIWAWQLPCALTDYLDWHGHWQELAAIQRTALAAATRLGDTAGEAIARCLLARAQAKLGDYGQAQAHLTHCLKFYRRLGDSFGEARVHQSLGGVAMCQGRHADALVHAEQALALFRATGHQAGQAGALSNAGWCHALLGDYQLARKLCWQALATNREIRDRSGEAGCWDILGYAEHKLDNLNQAVAYLRRALGIYRELGDRYEQAEILTHLGDVHHTAGGASAARAAWQQALRILDDLHHPSAAQLRAKLGQPGAPPVKPSKTPATPALNAAELPST